MKRLLCIVSAMNAGGAETFLMKIYRTLDRSRYQMDFCVNTKEKSFYDDEIISLGGKVYHIPSKSESFSAFSRQLSDLIRENGYQNVMRVTSNAMGFYDLYVAKKAGAANCIARSSNSSDGGGLKTLLVHRFGRLFFQNAVDVKIAPSDLAAIYTFGKRRYRNGDVRILHNGIDFDEYRFSPAGREAVRREFGIPEGSFVIGHIGRFTEQKNHGFLIDVFRALRASYPGAVLLLIGNGERKESVMEKVRALGLTDSVIFSGIRKDIPAVLSAMDCLAFPSLYEGMPNVIIEAQATGLPCVISDRITDQVVLSALVKRLPLSSSADWAKEIDSILRTSSADTGERNKQVLPPDYSIREVADQFVSYWK